jgi:DNA-binding beta-propeller fold protein YncE
VSVIDTLTNKVLTTTPVGTSPGFVVMTARNVYVANLGSDTVSVIDI